MFALDNKGSSTNMVFDYTLATIDFDFDQGKGSVHRPGRDPFVGKARRHGERLRNVLPALGCKWSKSGSAKKPP
jgi:hypothetical protein